MLSHVLTFQRRMIPPRHADKRISSEIVIPDTHPLCALFRDWDDKFQFVEVFFEFFKDFFQFSNFFEDISIVPV